MNKKILFLLLFLPIMMGIADAQTQSNAYRDTIEARVYFRQGKSKIDLGYKENGISLRVFTDRLREAFNDPNQRIGEVRIVGGASPEGRTDFNKALAADRAASVENWLRSQLPYPVRYETSSVGIDWEGLTRLVEAATNMPYKYEVLHILKNTPEWIRDSRTNEIVDGRKRRLGMLAGGNAWRWMEDHLFPELRSGGMGMSCEIIYITPPAHAYVPAPAGKDTVYVHDTLKYYYETVVTKTDTVYIERQKVDQRHSSAKMSSSTSRSDRKRARASNSYQATQGTYGLSKPFYMSIKTNALYDLGLVPNLGVEVSLGKRWSVGVNGYCAMWTVAAKNYSWCLAGGEVNVRKYIGKKSLANPLTGHHVGLYGYAITYDFLLGEYSNNRGYLGEKWTKSVGIDYGYSAPIGKRLNLDFTIGIGYLEGQYHVYEPVNGTYLNHATQLGRWFGPTKAEVSLIWLIGFGNHR